MNRNKILLFSTLIIGLAVTIICISYKTPDIQDIPETTKGTAPDPVALYATATEQVNSKDRLSYYIVTTQTMQFAGQEFSSTSQIRLNIEYPGTDSMVSSALQTLQIGNFSINVTECYEHGNGYITLDNSYFSSPISPEIFVQRYAPAICIDQNLYNEISSITLGHCTGIIFQNPKNAEHWAMPKDAVFKDAYGFALLDDTDALEESIYTITYAIGSASITKSIKIKLLNNYQLISPQNPEQYLTVDYLDAPILLEQACGYLMQAQNIRSYATTNMYCQMFSIDRTQVTDLTLSGKGDDLYAQIDVQINQVNQSRDGEITEYRQTESFENGRYYIEVNGSDTTKNEDITVDKMVRYCRDILIGDILLSSHIAGVTAAEISDRITFTFKVSNTLAEIISTKLSTILYSDPTLLHTIASDYETQHLQYVLTLDMHTGLPLSFSSQYSAYHTIDEISYQLKQETNQQYEYIKTSG